MDIAGSSTLRWVDIPRAYIKILMDPTFQLNGAKKRSCHNQELRFAMTRKINLDDLDRDNGGGESGQHHVDEIRSVDGRVWCVWVESALITQASAKRDGVASRKSLTQSISYGCNTR